jgi:hypothetical protein
MPPSVHVVVFSRARPLQLHGYLTSLYAQWRPEGAFRVSVLYRHEPPYDRAYEEVVAQFLQVVFRPEADFGLDLLELLVLEEDAPLTCFGTDDAVYVLPVHVPLAERLFRQPDLLGVSLRLGKNVTADMFGREQPQPAFLRDGHYDAAETSERWCYWRPEADGSVGDWAYPWEVVGTVYPTRFVLAVVDALVREGACGSPSQLEDRGWRRWGQHTGRRLMAAWPRSRLVVPTVNLVQGEFGNGIVGGTALSPEFLLDCWQRGLRLDTPRLRGLVPPSWRVGDFPLRRAA